MNDFDYSDYCKFFLMTVTTDKMPEGRDCQNPPQSEPQPRCSREPANLIVSLFLYCLFVLFEVISGYNFFMDLWL